MYIYFYHTLYTLHFTFADVHCVYANNDFHLIGFLLLYATQDNNSPPHNIPQMVFHFFSTLFCYLFILSFWINTKQIISFDELTAKQKNKTQCNLLSGRETFGNHDQQYRFWGEHIENKETLHYLVNKIKMRLF